MAQKKLKAKVKVPESIQRKKISKKGNAVTKRANRPVKSKSKGATEIGKLKRAVHKTVNKAVEEEIRSRASNDKTLSKAQQAVVEYHKKISETSGPA